MRICKECKWYEPVTATCRCFPPSARDHLNGDWPKTRPEDWCGQFTPAKKAVVVPVPVKIGEVATMDIATSGAKPVEVPWEPKQSEATTSEPKKTATKAKARTRAKAKTTARKS